MARAHRKEACYGLLLTTGWVGRTHHSQTLLHSGLLCLLLLHRVPISGTLSRLRGAGGRPRAPHGPRHRGITGFYHQHRVILILRLHLLQFFPAVGAGRGLRLEVLLNSVAILPHSDPTGDLHLLLHSLFSLPGFLLLPGLGSLFLCDLLGRAFCPLWEVVAGLGST